MEQITKFSLPKTKEQWLEVLNRSSRTESLGMPLKELEIEWDATVKIVEEGRWGTKCVRCLSLDTNCNGDKQCQRANKNQILRIVKSKQLLCDSWDLMKK